MSKENPLLTVFRLAKEGSLFVRRAQVIANDFKKSKKGERTERIEREPNTLDHFASEVLKEPNAFHALKEPCASSRFDWLLGMPARVSCTFLWKLWKERFFCDSPFDDLDKEIESLPTSPYLFRISRSVEPDEDTLGISGGELRRKKVQAISLPELMIAELFHFHETRGGHLNLTKSTLCAGTKFRDGTIPEVRFENRQVIIDWARTDHAEPKLGTRLVVK